MHETRKPQLHTTALDMLSRCGEQFRRRYVEGEIIPPGVALIVGIATHRSAAKTLTRKMIGGTTTAEQAADEARDALNAEWDKGVRLDDEERAKPEAAVRGAAVAKAVVLSALHARVLAPSIEPMYVERAWSVALPGYPVDLVGTLDVQERRSVRDLKTAGKSPPKNAAALSDQLTAYALAVRVVDGTAPQHVVLDHLVDLASGPKVVTLTSGRTPADFKVFLARVEQACRVIEKGVFTPARQTDWACSRKFCGYADTCPYFRGRITGTGIAIEPVGE